MLPDIADMESMPEPFEILELYAGQEIKLRPGTWKLGKALINPRDGRPARIIRVLRVNVSKEAKPTLPAYWDITSAHLIAGLVGHFEQADYARKVYKIKKLGAGPQARFTLDVSPAK